METKKKTPGGGGGGGPAFPTADRGETTRGQWLGMELRDWFAGMIISGICANPDISSAANKQGLYGEKLDPAFSLAAFRLADAMLKEREARMKEIESAAAFGNSVGSSGG